MTISKTIKKITFLLILSFITISCDKNDDDTNKIDEEAGEAEFIISNELNKDIVAIYKLPSNTEEEFIDTTETISSNNSLKFFETASFGYNPTPEDSFIQIEIFEVSDIDNPILTISPIENQDWEIIEQNLTDSGYGLTVYEYTLNNDSLN